MKEYERNVASDFQLSGIFAKSHEMLLIRKDLRERLVKDPYCYNRYNRFLTLVYKNRLDNDLAPSIYSKREKCICHPWETTGNVE